MRRKHGARLHRDPQVRRAVVLGDRAEKNRGDGSPLDFGEHVAQEAIISEMERVRPALIAAEAFLLGFEDNVYAAQALARVRRALKRGVAV